VEVVGQRRLWTLYSIWTGMKFPMYLMMYVYLDSSLELGADMKDLLQSLQSYSSRYYTANNLLLEPHKRIRHRPGVTGSMSRTVTPIREVDRVPDEESGSEYGSERTAAVVNSNTEGVERDGDGDEHNPESDVGVGGPRKRGGQRGKRKLKDMYLALDGSALLTLGMSSLSYI
jgi:hypothetical protein